MEQAPGGRSPSTSRPNGSHSLASRSRRIGDVSFGAVLDASDGPRFVWNAPDGIEAIGVGVAASVTGTGVDCARAIRERADATFAGMTHEGDAIARPRAFGGFAFHGLDPTQNTADEAASPDNHSEWGSSVWSGFDIARFVVPRVQVTRTTDGTWLTVVNEGDVTEETLSDWQLRLEPSRAGPPMEGPPTIVSRTRSTERETWRSQIARALETIETTALEKVVLAQAQTVELERSTDLGTILDELGKRYPECYRFAVDGTDRTTFFGAPPERLVVTDGARLETEALAGSAPRGKTQRADAVHALRLRESDKLDDEHAFVVDAIRSHLTDVTETVTVEARTIRRLATIQHLRTPITGTLSEGAHVLDVVAALHPTPAVGGVPQETALETIDDIEPIDRGWYAAPVGWFDGNGDGEFAVGIRSAVTDGSSVTAFAGNGIVDGSDADEEWTEIELKFRSILDVFQ